MSSKYVTPLNELERFPLLRNADYGRPVGYILLLPDLPDDWSKAEITPIRAGGKLIGFALHQPPTDRARSEAE